MTSQLGYLPKEMKSLANGMQVTTNANVIYAAPAGIHKVTTASGATDLTASQLLGGLVVMDPNTANNLTLPTAAAIVAASNGLVVGSSIRFSVINTAGGAEAITVVVNTGITAFNDGTVKSVLVVGQNQSADFVIVFTNVDPGDEAAALYLVSISSAVTEAA